jgi:peptidoglycan hydrolase-like protein with peptidoglycan-binding domain
MKEYDIDIDHVIRHYDVTGKCCPNPYVLDNRRKTSWTWEQFKERVKQLYTGAESVREGCYMTTFSNVHKGVNGVDALTVQRLLFAQDYKGADGQALKLDGDFGANSEHALKEFQKARGLTVDGDCGPNTWAALLGKA